MKLVPYEKYKDSGVAWLGAIPDDCKIIRLKNIIKKMVGGGTPSTENESYWNGQIPWVSAKDMKFDNISFSVDYITNLGVKESSTTLIKKNNVLLVVRSGILKHTLPVSINIVPVSINQDLKAIEPLKIVSVNFLFWYLKGLGHTILQKCNKVGATVDSLEIQEFQNFSFLLFPQNQQIAIVNYLDKKTTIIDKKIALLTKKIEHYQAFRKSLINETVCRGLDKSVKLKDSGIEWIGDVPEHWEVKRLKDISKNMSSGATPLTQIKGYYENGIVNWVNTGDLNDGIIEHCQHQISQKAINDYPNLRLNKKGTLLVAMYGATIGKIGILNIEATTNQACCCINLKKDYFEKFMFYWFLSNKSQIISLSVGGTQPNISQGIIGKLLIFIPSSKKEQIDIANYLDNQSQKIDTIITNIKKQIETLKKLRKTLINDVVTGKIKVS